MNAALSAIGIGATIYGLRRLSWFFAGLSEGKRPPLPSNDVFGDVVRLPGDSKAFHGGDHQ